MILTGFVAIVFGIVMFVKPGAGALAVLALVAAFALVTGIGELVVAIGGAKLLERKVEYIRALADVAEGDSGAIGVTVDLHDRTYSEPATSSPAPRASGEMPRVLDRDVRFGAAVYGSFLAASVLGVAYESEASARSMTTSLLGSMLVYRAAHVWSDSVGERIRLGEGLDLATCCFSPAANGRSSKLPRSRRCC